MSGKKGAYIVFITLSLLSTLLFACTIIQRPSLMPEQAQNLSLTQEVLPSGEVYPSPERTCDDSGDGGNNPSLQGTLRVTYGAKLTTYTDSCADANHLTEYYCDGREYHYYSKICPNGCVDGACLQNPSSGQPIVEQPAPVPFPSPTEAEPVSIPECFNGFRDLEETDTDCGGPNCTPCGYGKHCLARRDCVNGLLCNQRSQLCLNVAH